MNEGSWSIQFKEQKEVEGRELGDSAAYSPYITIPQQVVAIGQGDLARTCCS
jgi:hypothetical protein